LNYSKSRTKKRGCTVSRTLAIVALGAFVLALASAAQADVFGVFNMDGGLTSLDFVPVGNPGNTGEWCGQNHGGYGPDRICGNVDYTFNMGMYEVTAGQYTEFLKAVAATDTYGLYKIYMDTAVDSYGCNIKRTGSSGSFTYSVAAKWANRPVNFVSWGDAARFANWLTNGQPTGLQNASTTEDGSYYLNGATSNAALLAVKRKTVEQGGRYYIPTEDEWYKAAYHKNDGVTGNYFDYPTGSDSPPSNDLVTPDGGNNANFWQNGYTIGSPDYRTEVGDFKNSPSPYGTFDQGGNVWEWNEAILFGSYRGLRCGSFIYGLLNLRAACRYDYYPTSEGYDFGFRVSEVPEPASMALLALGGLGMLARRRGLRR
jgi:formylglycine-generating enzyme required for sulfatase activity